MARRREEKERDYRLKEKLEDLFQDCLVKNGPFKGMRYPSQRSIGSELYPKLIGSYETELHEVLQYILRQEYAQVIDIDCAEGYYAVGFAMRLPDSKVIAYDIDPSARELCAQMAKLNGVTFDIHEHCSDKDLAELEGKEKSLIFCDCEGYEAEIFNEALCSKLKAHDLLIECHDFVNIDITPSLSAILKDTHTIEVIESLDDISKAYIYDYSELENFSLQEKKGVFAERRPHIMRWIFAKSKVDIVLSAD